MSTLPNEVPLKPGLPASGLESLVHGRSRSESCARMKNLGFHARTHIKMYGERFEIVSDPFSQGDGIAVRAIGGSDPTARTLQLPIAILLGVADRFLKRHV